MLVLMVFALIAGVVLWIVLLLRKMAILVVVAFAPLLIAGWLWAPTRSWSRKATEVLVALVFSKTVIYMIFGIGMSLLLRSNQSLSDFVGVVVLLCGACFAPLVMLRLVHFAADSHLAGEMVGNLRAGVQPTLNEVHGDRSHPGMQRRKMASDYASTAEGWHGDGLRRRPACRRPRRPQRPARDLSRLRSRGATAAGAAPRLGHPAAAAVTAAASAAETARQASREARTRRRAARRRSPARRPSAVERDATHRARPDLAEQGVRASDDHDRDRADLPVRSA